MSQHRTSSKGRGQVPRHSPMGQYPLRVGTGGRVALLSSVAGQTQACQVTSPLFPYSKTVTVKDIKLHPQRLSAKNVNHVVKHLQHPPYIAELQAITFSLLLSQQPAKIYQHHRHHLNCNQCGCGGTASAGQTSLGKGSISSSHARPADQQMCKPL